MVKLVVSLIRHVIFVHLSQRWRSLRSCIFIIAWVIKTRKSYPTGEEKKSQHIHKDNYFLEVNTIHSRNSLQYIHISEAQLSVKRVWYVGSRSVWVLEGHQVFFDEHFGAMMITRIFASLGSSGVILPTSWEKYGSPGFSGTCFILMW